MRNPYHGLAAALPVILMACCWFACAADGFTSSYVSKADKPKDMPLDADVFMLPPGYNAPNQVHITQGNMDGSEMIISWITNDEPGTNTVLYGTSKYNLSFQAEGRVNQYKFFNYTSGFIHHCTLKNLKFDTKYYYEVGIGHTKQKSWFNTPPKVGPDSYDSNITLAHYESNLAKGQAVLFVGDLSYADNYNHNNIRWDTWGRFVERSAAYQPWIWTVGNHEIDFAPELGEIEPFKPYWYRYHVPYKASNSTAPFWYSIKRASAYIIVLSSYSAYGTFRKGNYTPQYKWLEAEFKSEKINRSKTPWLIVLMHSPWYNSYNYHYMEGESMSHL
ncbi:putative Acid phosphatase [Dioscorea sansibarensis]